MKRFDAQRTRGTTSFGFYLPETNRLTHNVRETRIRNLLKSSKGSNHEVLFHHRFSTSTPDVPNACHPFSTKDFFKNNYVGVHNGVISNDNELEKQHKELGINYVSLQSNGAFNDSEALIYDIARYLEGEVDELTARGSIAFIMIKRNEKGKPTTLFFGRNNGNPLKMKKTKHSITISSQGEGKDIDPNQLYSYDYDTGEITQRYLYIPYYSSYSGGYSHNYSPHGYYDHTGKYVRYDIEEEEDDLYMGYGHYGYSSDSAASIISLGNFIPRTGAMSIIEQDILEEADFDYTRAAIDALVEAEEAENEAKRINDAVYRAVSSEVYDDLCDHWQMLNNYVVMMTKISQNFEERAAEEANQQTIILDNGPLLPANT